MVVKLEAAAMAGPESGRCAKRSLDEGPEWFSGGALGGIGRRVAQEGGWRWFSRVAETDTCLIGILQGCRVLANRTGGVECLKE